MGEPVPTGGLMLERRPVPKTIAANVENTLEAASAVGSPITFIGLAPTFGDQIRVYRGVDRDWVFGPMELDPVYVERGGELPIPREQLEHLRWLVEADLDYRGYIAHDIPSGVLELAAQGSSASTDIVRAGGMSLIGPELARQVVQQPGPHARTVELARRYGRVSKGLMTAYAALGAMAGALVAVAAAPLLLVGSGTGTGTGAGTVVGIDPILFGAAPVKKLASGEELAAWYVLAEWSY